MKYNTLLQRFLNLVKQGQKEKTATVTLQTQANDNVEEGEGSAVNRMKEKEDATMTETLMSLSHRNWKNAEYIMKKILENKERWSCKGEFIHYREAVPPTGWRKFLFTLTELNIPVSTICNP